MRNKNQTITIELSEDPKKEIYVEKLVFPEIVDTEYLQIILEDNSEKGYSFIDLEEVRISLD